MEFSDYLDRPKYILLRPQDEHNADKDEDEEDGYNEENSESNEDKEPDQNTNVLRNVNVCMKEMKMKIRMQKIEQIKKNVKQRRKNMYDNSKIIHKQECDVKSCPGRTPTASRASHSYVVEQIGNKRTNGQRGLTGPGGPGFPTSSVIHDARL